MSPEENSENQTPNKTSKQLGVSAVILAVIAVLGFALTRQARSEPAKAEPSHDSVTVSEAGRKLAEVQTVSVTSERLSESLHLTGQITFSPDNTVKISPRLAGRVRQVFVKVGDHINAGQPLASLDSVDGATAQNTARQNETKLRLAQANLARTERLYQLGTGDVTSAQANLDQAKARTLFTKDALARVRQQANIGGFTQKPVEDAKNALVTAKSTLSQAQSDLALAERDRERKAKLVEIGVAAKSDLETSENVLEKAKTQVSAAKETVVLAQAALDREQKAFTTNLYADQQTRSAESDYRQAQLQEEAAGRALRLAKAAVLRDLQQAKSDLQTALADYENSRHTLALLGQPGADGQVNILSPISGIVTERNVSPGQIVDQSQMTPWQMFTISNVTTVSVDADVYEKDLAAVSPGASVSIAVAALPGRKFTGTVKRISPTLDPKTRAAKIRAEIDNPQGVLKDGMYAEVTVGEAQGRELLSVPLSAVQHDGDSDYVFVEETSGNYKKRTVKLGETHGERATLLGGVNVGEKVVSQGALFLSTQANG